MATAGKLPDPEVTFSDKQTEMILLAGLVTIILVLLSLVLFEFSKPRVGQVILPGGITYLGEKTTPTPASVQPQPKKPLLQLSAAPNAIWKTYTGKQHPFRFSYPESITVAPYPNAANETVVIRVGTQNPTEYLFLVVIDMTKPGVEPWKGKPLDEFVKNYASVTVGVSSVSDIQPITTINGLSGYRAVMKEVSGAQTDNIFFTIPKRPDRVLRLVNASAILAPELFTRIADSVGWGS